MFPLQGYVISTGRLSNLIIDVDKDWQAREIQNLKAIVAEMSKGDLAYRGASVLEKLPLSYGVGWNFLHALDAAVGAVEWKDIQDLIVYVTGGLNRWIVLPTLVTPAPSISLAIAEDHSGGSFVSTPPSLSIPIPDVSKAVAEDHSGGGFTATPGLSIPAPSISDNATALYEKYQAGDDAAMAIYGVNWEAQTFTPGIGHSVDRIILKVARLGSPGTVTVSIRATAAGLPTGADLVSGTFNGNDLPTTNVWQIVVITAQALAAATKYAIVVRATAGDASNYLAWRVDATSPTYAGGARCYSADSGGSWTEDTTRDYIFEEGVGSE